MLYFKDFNPTMLNIENSYVRSRTDQYCLFFISKPDIDLHTARKVVADRLIFQKEKNYPVFGDIRSIQNLNKVARDNPAKADFVLTQTVSIPAPPPASRAIPDLYFKMSKSRITAKVLKDSDKALRSPEPFL